jgi:hypothetical protein
MRTQEETAMSKTRKVLRTLVVVGVVGGIAALGALSAFSSSTDNPGNNVTAGSVTIGDNDGGTALYSMGNAKPTDSTTSCIRVSYTGTLDASVKLYTPSTVGALAPYVNLKVESGTQTGSPAFPSCSNFTADETLFDAALSTFPTTSGTGLADNPGTSATKWVTNDTVAYRVTATLSASTPDASQSATTGAHTIRWQAQNQ